MSATRWIAAPLLLLSLAAQAEAGRIYENRQDDPERKKLEKTEAFSQRGARAAASETGAHRADRPFQGTDKAGRLRGTDVLVKDDPYETVAGRPLTSGGPVRTPWVPECPNARGACNNVTPYQPIMDRILAGFKATIRRLQAGAIQIKDKLGLSGLATVGFALYLAIFRLAELVLGFAARTDQKAQAKVLAATARELQIMGEQMRTGKKLSPAEIELRSRKAGEKGRKEIKDRLGPKEL